VFRINIQTIAACSTQANSITERAHGKIKTILRKLTVEQPKTWLCLFVCTKLYGTSAL
jgi:hypothetical protein